MELYTLVSLLIGVFGGTFAALNALRTLLDADFQKISATAKEKAEAQMEISGLGHAANTDCESYKNSVTLCSRVWRYVSVVQVGFFTLVIYVVAFFARAHWDDISKHHSDKELAAIGAAF